MEYKILVLDIDGTLTNSKKEITPRTRAALKKAQEKGVKIVLASGRPTYGIMPVAKQLELDPAEITPDATFDHQCSDRRGDLSKDAAG